MPTVFILDDTIKTAFLVHKGNHNVIKCATHPCMSPNLIPPLLPFQPLFALKVALKQQNAELSDMDAFPVDIRLMKTVLCSLHQNVQFTVDLSLLLIISDDAVS